MKAAAIISVIVASFLWVSERPQTTPVSGRPQIVFVHGRDQAAKATPELEREWFAAFRTGLAAASLSSLVTASDYRLASYQLLYRPGAVVRCPADDAGRGARLKPLEARRQAAAAGRAQAEKAVAAAEQDVKVAQFTRPGYAIDVKALAEARSALRAAEGDLDTAANELLVAEAAILRESEAIITAEADRDSRFTQAALAAWDKFREAFFLAAATFPAAHQASLDFVLHDAKQYITLRPYRCATNAALDAVLEAAKTQGRPVVLVGHSMGTLVAYDLLTAIDKANPTGNPSRRYAIKRFISLGTQLGLESFIEPFAGFPPLFKVPTSVESWVNLRGEDDHVSPRRVTGHYDVVNLPFAEYLIPTRRGRPHDITGYLQNAATASAIAYAWCQAFTSGAPGGCAAVRDVRAGIGGARLP